MQLIAHIPDPPPPAQPQLGQRPSVHPSASIQASQIGSRTEIGPRTSMSESAFGDYSYAFGDNIIAYADIGKFCSIASHVRINPGNHPMDRVTQHHCTYRRAQYGFDQADDTAFFDWRRAARCVIGHAALIMPGVHIGTGAVIGAGAVVTKNVAPYQIIGGVPARLIRQRFDAATSAQLLAIAWWEWDRATLRERFHELMDVLAFLAKYAP